MTGLGEQTIRDAMKRGPSRADVALKIAQALDVNLEWLLTGEAVPPESSLTREEEYEIAGRLDQVMIPEVDLTYSMGGGSFADVYVEERRIPFRRDWLDRLRRGRPADFFLARGAGDSMVPTILDGDDVLVNRAEPEIHSQDRIWALGYGELGMIKRVRRRPDGQFELNSDNPAISSILTTQSELTVIGRVVWIGRAI